MTALNDKTADEDILINYRELVNAALDGLRPFASARTLENAIEYALFPGGKRLRPILALACGKVFGPVTDGLMSVALATELLHTASIIYDDLPCMDNTLSRRGVPSVHRRFTPDLAVLCGHSLVSQAFHIITQANFSPECCRGIMANLSKAIGPHGMAAGQVDDLLAQEKESGDTLRIAAFKTGPLFQSAGFCGAMAGGASPQQAKTLGEYGLRLGFAYQIADDFIDEKEEDNPDRTLNVIHEIGDERGRATFAAQLEIAEFCVDKIGGNKLLAQLIELMRSYAQ